MDRPNIEEYKDEDCPFNSKVYYRKYSKALEGYIDYLQTHQVKEADIRKILLEELTSAYDQGNIDDGGINGEEEAIKSILQLLSNTTQQERPKECDCKNGSDSSINRICRKCKGVVPVRIYLPDSEQLKQIEEQEIIKYNNGDKLYDIKFSEAFIYEHSKDKYVTDNFPSRFRFATDKDQPKEHVEEKTCQCDIPTTTLEDVHHCNYCNKPVKYINT